MTRLPSKTARPADRPWRLVWVLIASTLAGCATTFPMMPTPALYAGPQAKPLFTDVPAERRTPPLDLLFITDRAPATDAKAGLPYTSDRSRSVAFGSATIEFGDEISWDTLVKQSTVAKRTVSVDLKLGPTKELGRYPPIPYEIVLTPNGISRSPAVLDAHAKATQALQAEVARRLATAPRKEVVLYVHGVHNSFQDAALTMGELCHFLGREFVCGIFSWPAGGERGVLFGYEVDYESSAFSVEHLVKAIRTVAATPGLQRIHVLAHSRGTDVLATALSELSVEAYIFESTLAERYKIGNVVFAAADIDADIAPTKLFRILSDPDLPYGKAPRPRVAIEPSPDFKVTLYTSPDDKALATSSWLWGSTTRLGRVDAAMLSPQQIEQMRKLGLVDVIQVVGTTDIFGHGYYASNPRVSADLVALLRYRLKPNEPGRPLDEVKRPFWRVQTEAEAGSR
jgi:esterase/lipase superfamily enzyme